MGLLDTHPSIISPTTATHTHVSEKVEYIPSITCMLDISTGDTDLVDVYVSDSDVTCVEVNVQAFRPGSIVVFRTTRSATTDNDVTDTSNLLSHLNWTVNDMSNALITFTNPNLDFSAILPKDTSTWPTLLHKCTSKLTLESLNILLYRTNAEERDTYPGTFI